MLEKPPHGLFIVGTDTGVGKTYVGCCLARWLTARGKRVGVYKPVESGFDPQNPEPSDSWRLWRAAGEPLDPAQVCPQRFAAPLAPHLAARLEGQHLDADLLRAGLSAWTDASDIVLVEGAGGLLSPLGEHETVLDLARDFGYPLLLVASDSIGVINRVLQALSVASHYQGGVAVAGMVLTQLDRNPDASRATNAREIAQRTEIPVVAHLRYGDPLGEFDAAALSRWIDI